MCVPLRVSLVLFVVSIARLTVRCASGRAVGRTKGLVTFRAVERDWTRRRTCPKDGQQDWQAVGHDAEGRAAGRSFGHVVACSRRAVSRAVLAGR